MIRKITAVSTKQIYNVILLVMLSRIVFHTATFSQTKRDIVNGNLILFNDNGAWCWYQDERAVVDTLKGKLIIGSDASSKGVGGSAREGDVEATIFDLKAHSSVRYMLKDGAGNPSAFYADDHNAPALLVRTDGKYLAMYAAHNTEKKSYWRIFDGTGWSAEKVFDWTVQPGGADFNTTYSNLHYLSTEGIVYNISRGAGRSPNFMVSTDLGSTWSYGGRVTSTNLTVGYVDGYFRYCSNGTDRIDFVATEHHPRDFNTSIFHGYIKNKASFKTDCTLMDSTIFDQKAPNPQDYQTVFAANTVAPPGLVNSRCWNIDVQYYNDGTVATLLSTRVNDNLSTPSSDPVHAFFYCRYDGTKWIYTYLCKAGKKMYSSEEDYTGLGALCPDDPNTIYISTPVDPRDSTLNLGVREIFKGITTDKGATWNWIPVTSNSTCNNFRPIVPPWNKNNKALLWFRGTYTSAQIFNATVVGILENNTEQIELMKYVDASSSNTTFTDGSSLVTTGPDSTSGATDKKWHLRTGAGNDNSVLTSSETGGEDAPALKTTLTVPDIGTYDVWVNFWGNPGADWRIKAGLTESSMQLYRSLACKQVDNREQINSLVLSGSGNTYLYQAYVGRVQVADNKIINVFVNDSAVQVGTVSTLKGDVDRTWYDGISYAKVGKITGVEQIKNVPSSFSLNQNYPNPFNPSTTITYSIPKNEIVNLKVFDILGREVVELINKEMTAGAHSVQWNAQNIPSGVYFYKITAGVFSKTNKMLLLK